MLYLSEEDVRELLPMRDAIGLMRDAFEALARGEAINQPSAASHSRHRALRCTAWPVRTGIISNEIYLTHPRYGGHFYCSL